MGEKIYYLTKQKLAEVKKEYEKLVAQEHSKNIGEDAPKIMESDDMNPEFVSFQEDIDFLRAKIDELKSILDNHEIIKAPTAEFQSVVGIGAKVKIDVNGKKDEFTLVGTLEANPALGKISNESPVGQAIIGKKVGDEVIIDHPVKTHYKIRGIKYELS